MLKSTVQQIEPCSQNSYVLEWEKDRAWEKK